MTQPIVKDGQTLVDIALQQSGAVDTILELAMFNGLSITDELQTGSVVQSDTVTIRPDVVALLKYLVPVSAEEMDEESEGGADPILFEVLSLGNNKRVCEGQTPVDMVLQECGSIDSVFALADANSFGLTDDLTIGAVLSFPEVTNRLTTVAFAKVYRKPVSAESVDDEDVLPTDLEVSQVQVIGKDKSVIEGQTPVDIALQECGSLESLFEITQLNAIAFTEDLQIGSLLVTPVVVDRRAVEAFSRIFRKPVSGENIEGSAEEAGGAGVEFWGIEFDFIVS